MALTLRTSLGCLLAAAVLATAACGGKSIRTISADPSRYRNQDVKISGDVVDSYSIGSRGIYHVDDGTGRLWVFSEQGVPRRGARVTVWGTIRETVNLGAVGNLVKLPTGAIIMVERRHRAD